MSIGYTWLVVDEEKIVAIRGGEGRVDNKAKVDACLGCPVFDLKGWQLNLLNLMLKLTHVNGDIFVEQPQST